MRDARRVGICAQSIFVLIIVRAEGVATKRLSQPWRSTADVNWLPVLGTLSVCLETYMAIAVSGPRFALNIRAPPFLLEQLLDSFNLTFRF